MGMTYPQFLASERSVFGCRSCHVHLTTTDARISDKFNGQHGRAILFDHVVNVSLAQPEDRAMTTGLHRVRDVMCSKCNVVLGWKYDIAYVQAEKYKEGKFILEEKLIHAVE